MTAPEPPPSAGEDRPRAIGTFAFGDVITFEVRRVPDDAEGPTRYRVYGDDGAGPHLVCALTDDPEHEPDWHGTWNGDAWCARIEAHTHRIITATSQER